ncbi:MAG: SpoIID/LytB domain-containing protein [Bacillota bacterium]|nr:SpoIID/LytB domain-containing protein [Bacillota bacterium]MDW7678419.1 SpoIID/LytB domain-containing protein [Bacillota bacterium]
MKFRLPELKRLGRCTLIVLILIFLLSLSVSASMLIGTKVGDVLSTDIIATIDHQPIPSMNINGYTAIVVEDLRSYGFNVHWNESDKTLKAYRNPSLSIQPIEFNAEHMEPGEVLNSVLYTDIKTFLDGKEILSFNIDGRTAIYFNQLKSYGELQWNEATRIASFQFPEPVMEEPAETITDISAVTRRSTQLDPEESFLHTLPFDRSDIPSHINVGLYHGDTAVPSLRVLSGDGFMFGEFDAEQFEVQFQLKDYYQLNLTFDDGIYAGLKKSFENAMEAQQMLVDMRDDGIQAVLAREPKGWNIYMGPAASSREAAELLERASLKQQDWIVLDNRKELISVEDSRGMPVIVFHSSSPVHIASLSADVAQSIIQAGDSKYRGTITATRKNSQWLTIINRLSIEQYLYGVVPREMPASWHMEALKAQAVAARGFAMANIGKYQNDGFDLCTTVNTQVYGGYSSEHQRTNQAVDETSGKVMTANGKLVIPYYHANSGGHTESSEYVWNEAVSYARGVIDPYSLNAPYAEWETILSYQEIEQMLQQRQVFIGNVTDLMITDISPNGRVQELLISGHQGLHILQKQQTRWMFGLQSNYYEITQQQQSVVFSGRGSGHGIGMSQHGARRMAEDGYSWQQILSHYYTVIRIE